MKNEEAKVKTAKVAEGPKKSEKTKVDEKVDKKNLENTKKEITKEKDLMYQYPDDVTDLDSRKKFRTGARRKRDSFIKQITKAEKPEEKEKLLKDANKWAKDVFTKEHMPEFI